MEIIQSELECNQYVLPIDFPETVLPKVGSYLYIALVYKTNPFTDTNY